MSKRLQMTMSDDLMALVDRFAKFSGISRAAAVSVLCAQALSQSKAVDTMSELLVAYKEEQLKQGQSKDEKQDSKDVPPHRQPERSERRNETQFHLIDHHISGY